MDVSSVPVAGTFADLFSRTSAPPLFVWSPSRSGVGAARIGHSHCHQKVVDAHEYYIGLRLYS